MTEKNRNDNNDLLILPPAEQGGARVDKYLSEKTPYSRSRIAALIKDGAVLEDGETLSSADKKVRAGAVYTIAEPAPVPDVFAPEDIALDIVYEDGDLLVLNKPAGMVVHPAHAHYEGTLVNALLAHCKGALSGIGGVARPGIVHRLDKDTSGLMVVAKNDFTHNGLAAQFAVHSLERRYLALVWGVPQMTGEIETQIGRSAANRQKMAVVKAGGKHAKTLYAVKNILADGVFSLVECTLKTGRTHQVRVHMTALGHSLLGDSVYGKTPKAARSLPDFVKNFPRQALHSYQMAFIHPRSQQELRFELPLPPDMQAVVDAFSK